MIHDFLCKYSDKIFSAGRTDKFEEVGLIIDEYKKLKVNTDLDSLKINKKNKPILVKGNNPLPCGFGRKRI